MESGAALPGHISLGPPAVAEAAHIPQPLQAHMPHVTCRQTLTYNALKSDLWREMGCISCWTTQMVQNPHPSAPPSTRATCHLQAHSCSYHIQVRLFGATWTAQAAGPCKWCRTHRNCDWNDSWKQACVLQKALERLCRKVHELVLLLQP